MKRSIFGVMAVALMISIAAPASAQNKSLIGLLLGAAGGGFAGSQFGKGNGKLAFTALGTLLGAGAGQSVGTSLDRADTLFTTRPQAIQSQQQYPQYNSQGISQPYANVQSRYSPAPYAPPPVQRGCASGYTREYTTSINVGGRKVPAWGRACYMPDGSWRPVGGLNFQ